MGIVSYAQNFEDVLLNRVFGSMHYAFYVDIGAYHPSDDSVTKTFYDRGWDGINIEPGDIFDVLAAARPRDVNLRMAVYDRAGTIEFAQHPGWYAGLSHVMSSEDANAGVPSSQPAVETRTVVCDTLQNILDAHAKGRPIAFIKIDAEGAEYNIIRSTDWRAVRPLVILIEATKPRSNVLDNKSWEPILVEQGYLRAYFDGINCFYVPEERADLLHHFELPVNVLDGFRRHDPQLTAVHELLETTKRQLDQTELDNQALTRDLSHARDETRRGAEHVAALNQDLQSGKNALAALRERLDLLHAGQNAAVAAIVEANAYQIADLRRQSNERLGEVERLRRELNELLVVRQQAAALRGLIRELRWPDGPRALQAVLPLARALRRLAGTRIPPAENSDLEMWAGGDAGSTAVALAGARPRRPLARRAAWSTYAFFRPVGRPLAWRMRAFLNTSLHAEIGQLDHKLNALREQLARPVTVQPALPSPFASRPAETPDFTPLLAEMRQFGKMLEDTLLTLALENVQREKEG